MSTSVNMNFAGSDCSEPCETNNTKVYSLLVEFSDSQETATWGNFDSCAADKIAANLALRSNVRKVTKNEVV